MRHPSQPPPTIDTAIRGKVYGLLDSGPVSPAGFALVQVVDVVLSLHRSQPGDLEHSDTVKAVAAVLGLKAGDWR